MPRRQRFAVGAQPSPCRNLSFMVPGQGGVLWRVLFKLALEVLFKLALERRIGVQQKSHGWPFFEIFVVARIYS